MSSDDIANLYRQFGGQPDNYRELGRDNVVRQSRQRWPLLADVRQQDAARMVRPVSDSVVYDTGAAATPGPVPTVFDEEAAAAAQAAAHSRVRRTSSAPAATPVEPVLSSDRLPPLRSSSAPYPAPPQSRPPAAAGTELQGLFSRISHAPEPPAAPTDRDASLLRRLLRP